MPQLNDSQVGDWFSKFGIKASPEEIHAFSGLDFVGGGEAIAQYVLTKKNIAEQQANDPLNKVMQAEQTFATAQQAAAQGYGQKADELYGQLQQIMGQAPKLFGNLSTDQIDQYLAPLKTTFNAADAKVQTGAAARGLAGSSIESQTRADAGNTFKENVLSTGLTVGLNQQQQQEQAVQAEIQRQTGLLTGANSNTLNAFSLAGGAAGQLSQGQQQSTALLSSLPSYLQAQNLQQLIAKDAYTKSRGGGFMKTLGDINTGINVFKNFATIPASLNSNLPSFSTPFGGVTSPTNSYGPPSQSSTSAPSANSATAAPLLSAGAAYA